MMSTPAEMTDSPAGELRARQARCRSHQARLAWLAAGRADLPLPPGTADEVAKATRAILAEAEAAARAVTAGDAPGAEMSEFLAVRLARLQAAATQAAAAARRGDRASLRTSLRRFHALTAALWTVHQDLTADIWQGSAGAL